MSNKYQEMMEKVQVTEEIHHRIIKNIEEKDFSVASEKGVPRSSFKKHLSLAACFVLLAVSLTVIPRVINPHENQPDYQVIPDIAEYPTREALSKAVGFPVPKLSQLPFEVEKTTYTLYWQELAETEYTNQEAFLVLRKSAGKEDNSGDFNEYDLVVTKELNETFVTIKGNSEKYNLAIWEKDGYSYSLQSSIGLTESEILDMVKNVL